MRADARVVMAVLLGALCMGLPSPASAQDDATCVVYPNLCPPPTTTTPGGTTTPTTTTTPGGAATVTPGQGVADQPAASGGDSVGGGGNGDGGDGGDDAGGGGDDQGAGPGRAAGGGPIPVTLGRGSGGPGRCWYAIVHLDTERDDIEDRVRQALGEPCYVATMRAPVDLEGLRDVLEGTAFSGIGSDDDGRSVLSRLGREIGEQLVTPEALVRQVEDRMFSEVEKEIVKVSGIVVTHDEHDLDGTEERVRDVLANALVRGMREAKVPATNGGETTIPVVGTELTTTKPSWVPWFKARKISSVDNVDQRVGRRALSILMAAGGKPGHYGVKDTAEGLLPKAGVVATPVRFRNAGAVGTPAEASSGIGAATALMAAILALTSGWAIGFAGRRSLRRRLAGARR